MSTPETMNEEVRQHADVLAASLPLWQKAGFGRGMIDRASHQMKRAKVGSAYGAKERDHALDLLDRLYEFMFHLKFNHTGIPSGLDVADETKLVREIFAQLIPDVPSEVLARFASQYMFDTK